jgi:uncharacterized protein YcfL
MKKTFTILLLTAMVGCNANNKATKSKDSIAVENTVKYSMVDSAKMMLDSSDFYMRKGVTKQISQDETRAKVNPFMENFQRIYSKLSPADTAVVYQYRIFK